MSDPNVILYAFWGRKENIELQLPFIHRILRDHPNVEFHGWNLSQNDADDEYISETIRFDQNYPERLRVRNEFAGLPAGDGWNKVWEYYTDSAFSDDIFVKIDDDVVFIETGKFGDLINAVDANRGYITSPYVINNGACLKVDSVLRDQFDKLGVPQLDVHLHAEFAEMCHEYFIEDHERLLLLEPERIYGSALIGSDDWLSINMIGYDYSMGCEIQKLIGRRSPDEIAGRRFSMKSKVGDEGAVNMLPRLLMTDMIAVHLTFGPQKIAPDKLDRFRREIGRIGKEYLFNE